MRGTHITQFHTYAFTHEQDYRDNFADVLARTSRVVGVSGGVDEFGTGVALSEVGNVQASFFLISESRDGMTALRDELKKLLSWGVKRLWMQPSDPTAKPRWTRARVNNINIPERRDKHTDLWQKVTLSFQCSDPRWYSHPTAWLLDDGEVLDDGLLAVEGYRASSTTITNGSVLVITNNGSTTTPLYLRVSAGSNAVTDLRVSLRDSEDAEIGRWQFADTLASGQILEVDTTALSVTVTDTTTVGRYDAFIPQKGNGFLELPTGVCSLIFTGSFTGVISVDADYLDAWR